MTVPTSLIINSAFTEPQQHWAENPDRTLRLEPTRRPAGYEIIDTRENTRRQVPIPLVDTIRDRVRQWRLDGWPGTTAITLALLQHWWDADKVSRRQWPFYFCQLEAIETLIWHLEALPEYRQGIYIQGDGGEFERLCNKMATGSGKTTVMAMIITWQVLNALTYPKSPRKYSSAVFLVAPGWVVSNLNVGILYLLAMSSLGVYGIIMGGWASNSKYPFLGALRSAAQMVSYEVSIGLVIINVILLAGTMNLSEIVDAQQGGFWNWFVLGGGAGTWPTVIILFPMMIVFFISALAETNRPPFDLPEAESELVAGYQVEYSSTPYLLFMMGEYVNIIFMCAMLTILFFGGWNPGVPQAWLDALPAWLEYTIYLVTFFTKIVLWFVMFAIVKGFVPRYRYDQLMRLGWKIFLPTSLVAVVATAAWRVFAVGA